MHTVADYGAGGKHTTLAALAMGFEKIGHIEFEVFHPFLRWRVSNTKNLDSRSIFYFDPRHIDNINQKFDAIICSDVPEHVYDYNKLLRHLNALLKHNGLLVWVSLFGEGIDCHLHPELKGRDEQLLSRYNFKKLLNALLTTKDFLEYFNITIQIKK